MAKEYHPQMHTAEHILNQTMVRMFNKGRSFSAHLEKKKSKCDYHFERNLTETEVIELEKKVNDIISQNLNVTEEIIDFEIAQKLYNLQKLPEGVTENVRIIKVGEYDACPCIGQHVANTNEIGRFKVISTGFENGILRLRFKLEQIN
ncbi:MAG: hypothetical protein HYS24_08005 [Ignavibacteriales bacterium]|nr:hypothetical protein [Ignavibacteriales bacterium]